MKITLDTLTDDQIYEHLEWLEGQPYIDSHQRRAIRDGIEACRQALVPDGQRVFQIWWHAREQVAAAINARAAARCPGREHRHHVGSDCVGQCCTACGGPIDNDSSCRCD